jgi:hypothetical protein
MPVQPALAALRGAADRDVKRRVLREKNLPTSMITICTAYKRRKEEDEG